MDLKALLKTHEQVASKRKDLGAQACEQGYSLLVKAEQTGFKDKSLLKSASDAFIRAIRQERGNAESYVGLGYLLLLISDFEGAEKQLKAALQFAPDNADAKSLLEFSQHKRLGLPLKSAQPETEESEQLFVHFVDRIQTASRKAKASQLKQPLMDTAQLQILVKEHGESQWRYQQLEQELAELDLALPADSLKGLLNSFADLLRHQTKMIQTSLTFQKLEQALLKQMERVRDSIVNLPHLRSKEAIQDFEQNTLEDLLDHCDKLADQLDSISDQGHDIRSLERQYETLVQMIENLQEQIDGLLEQGF